MVLPEQEQAIKALLGLKGAIKGPGAPQFNVLRALSVFPRDISPNFQLSKDGRTEEPQGPESLRRCQLSASPAMRMRNDVFVRETRRFPPQEFLQELSMDASREMFLPDMDGPPIAADIMAEAEAKLADDDEADTRLGRPPKHQKRKSDAMDIDVDSTTNSGPRKAGRKRAAMSVEPISADDIPGPPPVRQSGRLRARAEQLAVRGR